MRPFPRYTYPAKNRHSTKLIVLPPSPKNGAPRQLSPINPSIPRIHLKPLPAQHRVLNSVPKHVANNYRDVVPRNPASCLCFFATEPNFHLKREKERKKKKERKRRKKQKPPLLVGVSGFVSQPCATLLLPVVRARSNERGQREREIERKREREGAAGAPSSLGWRAAGGGQSRRGPRSLGPPAGAGGSGAEEGSTARWRGPWRQTGGRAPALARRVSRQSGPHLPAKTQLPFRHRPRDTNRPSAFPVSLSPTESRHRKGHASDSTGLYYLFRHSFAFFSFLFLFLPFAQLSPD